MQDLVDALIAAVADGQYLDINMDPRAGVPLHPAIKYVRGLRASEDETLAEVAAELLSADKCSTTLVRVSSYLATTACWPILQLEVSRFVFLSQLMFDSLKLLCDM